jgi:hypothetical protein
MPKTWATFRVRDGNDDHSNVVVMKDDSERVVFEWIVTASPSCPGTLVRMVNYSLQRFFNRDLKANRCSFTPRGVPVE